MIDLLAANPLLLLFLTAAIGYPLGRLRILGFQLGVAAVLFVGLAFGALDPRLALPDFVFLFGLVLFVYTIGLAGGPSFFAALRRGGLRDNALVLVMLLVAAGLAGAFSLLLDLGAAYGAGLFAGSLTNTPALASLIEVLQASEPARQAEPVVAYSLTYPVGVIGVILAITYLQRRWRTDYPAEARALKDLGAGGEHLENVTVRVSRPEVAQQPLRQWREQHGWHVIFGRYRRAGSSPDAVSLVQHDTTLQPGDEVSVIGSGDDLAEVVAALGEVSDDHLEFDRSQLDFRRVFVSEPSVAGKTLAELKLPQRFGALVTRVRRGDVDMLPDGGTRLELGDRVRVVARRDQMAALTHFFGDSYRSLAEIDVLSFGLGIALGLLLGLVPIPLPGGLTFHLGFAGGPLLVALVLGALGRTGPVVWQLPYSANLTLRQIGLVLFLAGIGTRSGFAFASTLAAGGGLGIFVAGVVITCLTAVLTLTLGHRLLGIPMSLLIGMVAGLQTQPAVLAFANEQTGNDLPNVGYATVFPLATVVKIVLAQLLLALL